MFSLVGSKDEDSGVRRFGKDTKETGKLKEKVVEKGIKEKKSIGFFKYGEYLFKSKLLPSWTVVTVEKNDASKRYLAALSVKPHEMHIQNILAHLGQADPDAIKDFVGLNRLHALSIMTNIEILEKNGLISLLDHNGKILPELKEIKENLSKIKNNLKEKYAGLENLGYEDSGVRKKLSKAFEKIIAPYISEKEDIDDGFEVINVEGIDVIEKGVNRKVEEKLELNSKENKKDMEERVSELFSEKELKKGDLGVDKRLWNDIDRAVYTFYDQPMDKVDDKSNPIVLDWPTERANDKEGKLDQEEWQTIAVKAFKKYFDDDGVSLEMSKLVHQQLPIALKKSIESNKELYENGDATGCFTISPESGKREFIFTNSRGGQGLDYTTNYSIYNEGKGVYTVKAVTTYKHLNSGQDLGDKMLELDPRESYATQTTIFKVTATKEEKKAVSLKCENLANTLDYKLVVQPKIVKKTDNRDYVYKPGTSVEETWKLNSKNHKKDIKASLEEQIERAGEEAGEIVNGVSDQLISDLPRATYTFYDVSKNESEEGKKPILTLNLNQYKKDNPKLVEEKESKDIDKEWTANAIEDFKGQFKDEEVAYHMSTMLYQVMGTSMNELVGMDKGIASNGTHTLVSPITGKRELNPYRQTATEVTNYEIYKESDMVYRIVSDWRCNELKTAKDINVEDVSLVPAQSYVMQRTEFLVTFTQDDNGKLSYSLENLDNTFEYKLVLANENKK